jgi:ubiquinol oxidase
MKTIIRLLVGILVFVTDYIYQNRPYPRFYALETIARVPYFAYRDRKFSVPAYLI